MRRGFGWLVLWVSTHTLTLGSVALRRRCGTCPLLDCISGTCGSTIPYRTFVPGKKEAGNREKAVRQPTAGQIPPSAMQGLACCKVVELVTPTGISAPCTDLAWLQKFTLGLTLNPWEDIIL